MNLYLITSDIAPMLLIKALSVESATDKFCDGMSDHTANQHRKHPSLKVRLVTVDLLLDMLPEECKIDRDPGF